MLAIDSTFTHLDNLEWHIIIRKIIAYLKVEIIDKILLVLHFHIFKDTLVLFAVITHQPLLFLFPTVIQLSVLMAVDRNRVFIFEVVIRGQVLTSQAEFPHVPHLAGLHNSHVSAVQISLRPGTYCQHTKHRK